MRKLRIAEKDAIFFQNKEKKLRFLPICRPEPESANRRSNDKTNQNIVLLCHVDEGNIT